MIFLNICPLKLLGLVSLISEPNPKIELYNYKIKQTFTLFHVNHSQDR